MAKVVIFAISVFSCGLIAVNSHVRLWKPISRSSIFRDPRFTHLQPEPNWEDHALNCGRIHQKVIVDNCGVCGDPISDLSPRPNENGGIYGRGILVENYRSGENINIVVEFTTTHLGYIEYQICGRVPETEDCFRTLELASGRGTQVPVIHNAASGIIIHSTLKLPRGFSCEHCVLRINYRAGNNWGNCGNGTEGMGCGLQETFRHCSDISIQ